MKRFLYKIISVKSACQTLSDRHIIITREIEQRISLKKAKIILPKCLKRGLPCQE